MERLLQYPLGAMLLWSSPAQHSGPPAGAAPLARRHRPVVGAAPDGSPDPAAPAGPG